jgi:hypothetical protein
MVVGVRKLKARMTSAMSRAAIEDFERKMPGCIGEIWWLRLEDVSGEACRTAGSEGVGVWSAATEMEETT